MPPPLSTTSTTASSPTRLNGIQPHLTSPNGVGLQDTRPQEHSPTSSNLHPHSSPRTREQESIIPWNVPYDPHAPPSYSPPSYPDHHHPLTTTPNPRQHSPPHPDTTGGGGGGGTTTLWGPATAAHRTHFTGPASGYLEDHRLLFDGRGGGITGNPGRTIYSQQRAPNR